MLVKMGIFPKDRGEHKKYWKPLPRIRLRVAIHIRWIEQYSIATILLGTLQFFLYLSGRRLTCGVFVPKKKQKKHKTVLYMATLRCPAKIRNVEEFDLGIPMFRNLIDILTCRMLHGRWQLELKGNLLSQICSSDSRPVGWLGENHVKVISEQMS